MRKEFRSILVVFLFLFSAVTYFFPLALWSLVFFGPLLAIGIYDYFQIKHTVRRNFPLFGHFRYIFESIRPEINQYFVESNTDGMPFSRELRSVVYQRAKGEVDTLPFGTQKDVYQDGYEWVNHSLHPISVSSSTLRVTIGGPDCLQPYSASLFNISAMSFGALSQNAILALSSGAKQGNFYHNTGEGSVSPHHLEGGGDLVYQIGTGYFGCRTAEGDFSPEKFKKVAANNQIKMIEIKLSQGAKPGHGGILPAKKLSPEIAAIRDVPMGKDVLSPPAHSAFKTAQELCYFIQELRVLSKGKPIGFKLCVGVQSEFIEICKAMIDTQITPDFITVDGAEGGTGAAPPEFSNSVGTPLRDGLIFVRNSLVGFGLKERIKIIASGKVITAFDVIRNLALGADLCNSARGMMLALGCIQALRCNTNKCPVGIATQDPELMHGLNVPDKAKRVAHFHHETLQAVAEMMGAMGIDSTMKIKPQLIQKRTANGIQQYSDIYQFAAKNEYLESSPKVA